MFGALSLDWTAKLEFSLQIYGLARETHDPVANLKFRGSLDWGLASKPRIRLSWLWKHKCIILPYLDIQLSKP